MPEQPLLKDTVVTFFPEGGAISCQLGSGRIAPGTVRESGPSIHYACQENQSSSGSGVSSRYRVRHGERASHTFQLSNSAGSADPWGIASADRWSRAGGVGQLQAIKRRLSASVGDADGAVAGVAASEGGSSLLQMGEKKSS